MNPGSLVQRLRLGGVASALGAALLSSPAEAQHRRSSRSIETSEAPPDAPTDLRGRFGLERVESLLARDEAGATLRAIDRARSLGTPEALALVAPERDPLLHVRGDGRAAIELVRALALHLDQPNSLHSLGAFVTVAASDARKRDRAEVTRDAERFELARHLAAMALAGSAEPEAAALLASARVTRGPAGRAANAALLAYPRMRSAQGNEATLDDAEMAAAGNSGDLRAVSAVRRGGVTEILPESGASGHGSVAGVSRPPSRSVDPGALAHALDALAALGDTRALETARALGKDKLAAPIVRVAAARVLATFGDEGAAHACAELIADDATQSEGIDLAGVVARELGSGAAAGSGAADLLHAVAARLATASDVELRRRSLAALATFRTPEAIGAIVPFAADPTLAVDAAESLARSPLPAAAAALTKLALAARSPGDGSVDPSRLALRAATVRWTLRRERLPELARLARRLAGSTDPRNRAVADRFLVTSGQRTANEAMKDPSPEVRRAVLAAASFQRDLFLRAAEDVDPVVRALAYGALEEHAPDTVASDELRRQVRESTIDAPLAARVLASRATMTDASVLALLIADDPLVRREAWRGYARSAAPDRSGRLLETSIADPDVAVRRVALSGLAAQSDVPADFADELALSARLDPDPLARAAARGIRVRDDAADVVWLHSDRTPGGAPYEGVLATSGGVINFAFDSEGDAILAGVSSAEKQLRLAPRVPMEDAPSAPR